MKFDTGLAITVGFLVIAATISATASISGNHLQARSALNTTSEAVEVGDLEEIVDSGALDELLLDVGVQECKAIHLECLEVCGEDVICAADCDEVFYNFCLKPQ